MSGAHAGDIRRKVEEGFASFGRLVYRRRLTALALMLACVAALASQLPKVRLDTSTEGFLHEKDPALVRYYEFRDQFGRDEMLIIAIEPRSVFDLAFLRKLKAFHEELAGQVPHLDDITSMVNARNTRGEGDRLIVEDLLEDFPRNERELAALRERVLANPLYRNLMINEKGTFTTIVIKTNSFSSAGESDDVFAGFEDAGAAPQKRQLLTDAENSEVVRTVREIAARYDAPDFRTFIAGSPVVTDDLKKSMMRDMRKFMVLALVVIAATLFALFRRLSGVLLPLAVVIVTLLSTLGLMGLTGTAIKLPTQILPSFLLAVCVGASVHVLAVFFHRFQATGDQQEAIVHALGHSGLAIVMTSVTTAAGLASFATAGIAPIADLGVFASSGVMLSLLYTVVLLPALLSFVRLRKREQASDRERHARMDRILTGISNFSTGRPVVIIVVSAALILASFAALTRLRFSHNPLLWLNKRMAVREATATIDREMRGSVALEVITDTGTVNGLYEPSVLNRLDELGSGIGTIRTDDLFVGKTISVTDILKEINQALNENRPGFYRIPQDRALVAQELLLFENAGSDDLEDVVDSQLSRSRMTVKLPWLDAVQYRGFIEAIEARFRSVFGPDADVTVTGIVPLFGATVHAAMDSAAKSYVIALIVITILMVLFIGELRLGLVSMVPNLLPIVLTMGLMTSFGMPLDMFTMLIGSIAIGLAVDDTIHFMHNFRRYRLETGDPREAVLRTLLTTGRAMLVTSVVLSLGFFIFAFASMYNIVRFGVLTGFTIVTALIADFVVAPALVTVLYRQKK